MIVSDGAAGPTFSARSDVDEPGHAGAKRKLNNEGSDSIDTVGGALDSVKRARVTSPAAPTSTHSPSIPGLPTAPEAAQTDASGSNFHAMPTAFSAVPPSTGVPAVSRLPPELWLKIALNMSPASLAKCLRVCKTLNFYLTGWTATQSAGTRDATRVPDSNAVWTHVRKAVYPTLPRPMQGLSELEMLQLIGNLHCQSCGKEHVKPLATNVFNAGPGESGVRVIWPFRLRLCGTCFANQSLTVRHPQKVIQWRYG